MVPACCITFAIYENMIAWLLPPPAQANGGNRSINEAQTLLVEQNIDSKSVFVSDKD